MNLLSHNELRSIFIEHLCQVCGENIVENNPDIIKAPSRKLCYIKCKSCDSAFKLFRREMRHPMDKYIYEHSYNDGGPDYAVKGYSISSKTFENNRNKFHVKENFSNFLFSEDEFLID